MKPPPTPHYNARWRLDHDPDQRPLGCNGRYGNSGRKQHARRGEPPCQACRESVNHYDRERRRGQPNPRTLKPCGTNAAAKRHLRRKEPVCFKCRVAEAKYVADLKTKRLEETP